MSLLTTSAGRVLRISPPIAGSNATHHTSPRRGGLPRVIGDVAGDALDPFRRLALALLVRRHRPVACHQIPRQHMRPRQIAEKPADPSPSDDAVKTGINLVVDGNGQFFRHAPEPLYVYHT